MRRGKKNRKWRKIHNYELHRTHNYEMNAINVMEKVGLYRVGGMRRNLYHRDEKNLAKEEDEFFSAVTCLNADGVTENTQSCE